MITYGSYLAPQERILSSATWIVIIDTAVALFAGFAIFPAVFAMHLSPAEGPGLVFQIVPAVFARMPMGQIFSALFFLLLFLAAVTSGVSLLEVVTAYFIDERGWSRRRAVLVIGTVTFLFGIPSALSFGSHQCLTIGGLTFFDFMDKLTSNYMLPLGGLFIALSLGWKYGLERTMHELDVDTPYLFLREVWAFMIKYVSPCALLLVFLALAKDDVIALFKYLSS